MGLKAGVTLSSQQRGEGVKKTFGSGLKNHAGIRYTETGTQHAWRGAGRDHRVAGGRA